MTQKILALDLGQSSIGWLIRNTDYQGVEQFEKFGVVTFKKGVGEEKNTEYSFARERTKYRSMRRLYQARKYKLWETLKKLKKHDYCPIKDESLQKWATYNKSLGLKREYPIDDLEFAAWIKLDFNNDNKPDFISPYQLRKYLAENKLDFSKAENRYILGRALYHIAQHRAFKSSKKVKSLDSEQQEVNDVGAEKKKKEELRKMLEKNGLSFDENKTIGQLLAEAELFFKNRGYGRIRNELQPYVTRKMLQQEVEQIFKFQFGDNWKDKFKEIFEVDKVAKCSIFWQRPLRSQKSAVGKCTLEKNKYRCPVSHPEFEIFRAWAFINNLRYKLNNENEEHLSLELKNKLFEEVFVSKDDFNVLKIKEWLKKEIGNPSITLNYSDKTHVPGSPTIFYLKKILGENWKIDQIEHEPIKRIKKSKSGYETYISNKNYYNYEDIWHVAFQLEDEEEIENIARNKFKFNDEQIKAYLNLFNSIKVDYAKLSLKALKNINYFLKKGLIYTDAVLLAKIPDILRKKFTPDFEEKIINSLNNIISENRKKKNILNITNALISEYKINHFHEKDYQYTLQKDDLLKIEQKCQNFFGTSKWNSFSEEEKKFYLNQIQNEFQTFFRDKNREYKKLPKLVDDLKDFLRKEFNSLTEKELNKLYHPSAIDIYPKLTDKDKSTDGKLYLKNPQTGSWKNPMALRVLNELKKLINYLIQTEQIDEDTKIVVEIPRELNDANRRKSYEIWQKRREEENKQFAIAISELLKDKNIHIKANPDNDSDIDKFRLWYEQCFNEIEKEFTKDGANELVPETKRKKNKKGEETTEDTLKWAENDFSKINTSLWFKIQKAKDNVIEKYKLWNEQKAMCIYTGKLISISDLFSEDVIDIEHTIPYSRSFDNSLANKTVCFKEYNRKTKQNRLPSECPNYKDISERIKPWQEKIENIKKHLEFWKNETKKANNPKRKNDCIIQKHLWNWELEYWENKVKRFLMTNDDINDNFVRAQLNETQLISKYAFHYLKTLFNNVQVQKGSVTADFAKILGVRDKYKPKVRIKHTHHVVDAMILSLIPDSARLKSLLEKYGRKNELEKISNETKDRELIMREMEILENEIKNLLIESRIPINSLFKAISLIENSTICITSQRSRIFSIAKKKIRKGKLKGKIATGDVVRGQLHKESFYGKIRLVEKDENGKPLRDENGNWKWVLDKNGNPQFAFVKRVPVDENLKIDEIIDPEIKKIFEEQIKVKSLKEMNKEGGLLYTDPKTNKTIRIRHVRCFQKPTDLLEIKKQTYPSKYEYKSFYYADNAENIFYALYEDENGNRTYELLNLFNATKIKQCKKVLSFEDFFIPHKKVGRGKNKSIAILKAILHKNHKVILFENSIHELKEIEIRELTMRIYNVYKFHKDGRLYLQHHLEARNDKELGDGPSKIDFNNLQPRYFISKDNFNFAIEGRDFEIKPDGNIIWKF